jgi:hypothetical protein
VECYRYFLCSSSRCRLSFHSFSWDTKHLFKGLTLALLRESRIAPRQMRIIPIQLSQTKPFLGSELRVNIAVHSDTCSTLVTVVLPIKHIPMWSPTDFVPIQASYFFTESQPSAFVAIPPKKRNEKEPYPPLLALRAYRICVNQFHEKFLLSFARWCWR